jgi:hypothetical protein
MRGGATVDGLSEAAREHLLEAWALVDLKKAESLFEAELASDDLDKLSKQSNGFFKMVEMLATPPQRRDAALTGLAGWSPGPIE